MKIPTELERRFFQEMDQWFIAECKKQDANMDGINYYSTAVDLAAGDNGSFQVDLGTGHGYLLKRLKAKLPNSAVIGVEESQLMMEETLKHLRAEQIPVVVLKDESETTCVNFENPQCPVVLIQQDIRRMSFLRKLLGEKLVDAVFYMRPVPIPSLAMDLSVRKYSPEDTGKMMWNVIGTTNKSAYRFMSSKVKPSGRAVLAYGKALDEIDGWMWPEESTVSNLVQMTRNLMGKFAKYWDSERIAFCNDNSGEGFNVVATDEDRLLPPIIEKHTLVMHSLVRNARIYREE